METHPMIRLIVLCLLLAGGIWLGLHLRDEQGMVMIAFGGKSYEMSLFVGGAIALITFGALYFILRLLAGFFQIPAWTKSMREKRRAKKSQNKTHLGLVELAQGHWAQAENLLIQGTKGAHLPLINYLSAAKAASEQGLLQQRDEYLALAHELTSDKDVAVGLTQAKLQLSHGQFEQSLATLKHLRTVSPKHPHILKLMKTLYLQLKDWPHLIELLPLLERQNVITQLERRSLEEMAYIEQLKASLTQDIESIKALWQKMPKYLHISPQIVFVYAQHLIFSNHKSEAEAVIKYCLKKQWDESLIILFGNFKSSNPTKNLSLAEGWLKSHSESAGLLLTCGRLAAQNELWGKAQRYLEACLQVEKKVEAYAALGIIYEKMDKPALSAECFRKGMLEASHHQSTSPDNLLEHKPSQSSHDDME